MKKLFEEFKDFISRGNVIGLAVGVMIGGAFTNVVNTLVKELFMPLIGIITGGVDFGSLSVTILDIPIHIGNVLTAAVNFLCIALILFAIIKMMERVYPPSDEKEQK